MQMIGVNFTKIECGSDNKNIMLKNLILKRLPAVKITQLTKHNTSSFACFNVVSNTSAKNISGFELFDDDYDEVKVVYGMTYKDETCIVSDNKNQLVRHAAKKLAKDYLLVPCYAFGKTMFHISCEIFLIILRPMLVAMIILLLLTIFH